MSHSVAILEFKGECLTPRTRWQVTTQFRVRNHSQQYRFTWMPLGGEHLTIAATVVLDVQFHRAINLSRGSVRSAPLEKGSEGAALLAHPFCESSSVGRASDPVGRLPCAAQLGTHHVAGSSPASRSRVPRISSPEHRPDENAERTGAGHCAYRPVIILGDRNVV